MKPIFAILFATILSFAVNAEVSTVVTAPLVLDSEATDFESEAEYGDAQGMVYLNSMRSGRSFYLGDYLGFDTAWIYRNDRGFTSHHRGFEAYRNF